MMPWEHVFVGYICYSLLDHAVHRASPTSRETLIVVVTSLLPDLIDKPLAWEFGVFQSGYAIGHSVFFALALSIGVGWLAVAQGRPRIGWAFAVGYILHPITDVISKYLRAGELQLERILWPVRSAGNGYETGFTGEFTVNFVDYFMWVSRQIVSGDLDPYLFLVLGIGITGILLWVYDGMPVGREISHSIRRAAKAIDESVGK